MTWRLKASTAMVLTIFLNILVSAQNVWTRWSKTDYIYLAYRVKPVWHLLNKYCRKVLNIVFNHNSYVIMSARSASQITDLSIICSTVCLGVDQRKHQSTRHWPLWGEFTDAQWIPLTKGQKRGKCFHLMTSSCLWQYTHFYSSLMCLYAYFPF